LHQDAGGKRVLALHSTARNSFAMRSSRLVQPAAGQPMLAQKSRPKLAIINPDETGVDGHADTVVHVSIGETLTEVNTVLPTK